MDEFIDHIPFLETRNYVKQVVRNYQIYNLLYSGGTHSANWLIKPVGSGVKWPRPHKRDLVGSGKERDPKELRWSRFYFSPLR